MKIVVGSWIFPLFVTVVLAIWTYMAPTEGKYDFRGLARFAASIVIGLVVWLVWAIMRLNVLPW